ncbi:hypothetical protein Glove_621g14 [Diversispora epigaea]|uniref:TLDc domain-containing protein n=1 Tax=Diversispora epigaea TaxID=1348612 RepID=A0A397GEC5_9GLOM|nr:hypothetical protein Glove_621g14 [Diversispora epigaea]
METNDSFIFSLKNGDDIQNSILSRVIRCSKALYYSNNLNIYGPWLGNYEFMMKSNVSNFSQDKECSCDYYPNSNCYERPIRKTTEGFSIVDYEVFEIIKKH